MAASRLKTLEMENAVWNGNHALDYVRTIDIRSIRTLRDPPERHLLDLEMLFGPYYVIARAVSLLGRFGDYDELRCLRVGVDVDSSLWTRIPVPEGFQMFTIDPHQALIIVLFTIE
jgi:hypothetical protein